MSWHLGILCYLSKISNVFHAVISPTFIHIIYFMCVSLKLPQVEESAIIISLISNLKLGNQSQK